MKLWLYKKTLPILLSLAFSVVGFGVSFEVANASLAVDITKDLNLPINASRLPPLVEIPQDITQDQATTIRAKIETDTGVVAALSELRVRLIAVATTQNAYDSAVLVEKILLGLTAADTPTPAQQAGIDTTVTLQKTALDAANADSDRFVAELGNALILARTSQNDLVSLMQENNRVANLAKATYSEIASTTQNVTTGLTNTASGDITASGAAGFDLSTIPPKTSAWSTASGDDVAIAMQDSCVINHPATRGTTFMPCVAIFAYGVIYKPVSQVLRGSGIIFDKMLSLSIEGNLVAPGFIDTAWKVVRDFSNMLFIFVLLYTGIMTMFGAADWRKVVLQVVVIALLINFSLFFTKVVIDAGNVLAVGVKSAIGTTSVSAGLAASFQPQKFLKTASSANKGDTTGGSAIIVFLVAAIVSGYAAYVFFKAALLFMGRLIAFWFLMIVSPFAFISTTLPKGNKFQEWLSTLLGQAFVAPVFLFLIYLIMMVIQSGDGILASFSVTGTTWFEALLGPAIVATLLIVALQQALKFTEDMAGSFGKLGSEMAGKAMGMTAMIATGGVAMAGRAGGGRLAQMAQDSGALKNLATSDNYFAKKIGRAGLDLADKGATGSWDVRGADGFIGKNINKGIKATVGDVGKVPKTSAGGLVAAQERRRQEDFALAKKLKMSEDEKRKIAAQADPNYTVAKNRVGREQDAVARANETSRTSISGVAFTQAQAQNSVAQTNLTQISNAAQGSSEGQALAALNNNLTALVAAETQAKTAKTNAENAYNTAAASGALTTAITSAFTNAVGSEAAAITARATGETNKNTAQATFDAVHGAAITAATTAATTATAVMNSAAVTDAASAEKQAEQAAEAQLKATTEIITQAEKAATNMEKQRTNALAQDVERRGWTEGVLTESGKTRQSQTAADIRGDVPSAKKSETEKLLEKLLKASENK